MPISPISHIGCWRQWYLPGCMIFIMKSHFLVKVDGNEFCFYWWSLKLVFWPRFCSKNRKMLNFSNNQLFTDCDRIFENFSSTSEPKAGTSGPFLVYCFSNWFLFQLKWFFLFSDFTSCLLVTSLLHFDWIVLQHSRWCWFNEKFDRSFKS